MIEGIAFYALYKSRVLIIPWKADDCYLFIGLPAEISKTVAWYRYPEIEIGRNRINNLIDFVFISTRIFVHICYFCKK